MTIMEAIDKLTPKYWDEPEMTENAMRTMRAITRLYGTLTRVKPNPKKDEKMEDGRNNLAQIVDLCDKFLDFVEAMPEGDEKRLLKRSIVAYVMSRGREDSMFDMLGDFAPIAYYGNKQFHFVDVNDYPDIRDVLEENIKETFEKHGKN